MRRKRIGMSEALVVMVLTLLAAAAGVLYIAFVAPRMAPYAVSAQARVHAELIPWAGGSTGAILRLTVVNTGNVDLQIQEVRLYGPGCTGAGACRYSPSDLGLPSLLRPSVSASAVSTLLPNVRKLEDYVVTVSFSAGGRTIQESTKVVWAAS